MIFICDFLIGKITWIHLICFDIQNCKTNYLMLPVEALHDSKQILISSNHCEVQSISLLVEQLDIQL